MSELKSTKNKNRIAIFAFHDSQGVVDNSVLYLLEQAKPFFKKLLIVANGELAESGQEELTKITNDIIIRENKDFDAQDYKAGIEHLGWEEIETYDNLVFFNSSNFGPLYPLQEMLKSMESRNLDFWGVTKHHGSEKFTPYIEWHWVAIGKNMLRSADFKNYWRALPKIKNEKQLIEKHEAVFTKKFADKNFKWDVYANTDAMAEYSERPSLYLPFELIKNYHSPFIQKKCFAHDYYQVITRSLGRNTRLAFGYIKDHTEYDSDIIWDTILRLYNYADVKNNLHLNYVLPSDIVREPKNPVKITKKIALVIHIHFIDLVDYCFEYAKSMPEYTDVYITTNSEEKKTQILEKFSKLKCKKLKVTLAPNRGRDVGPFLVENRNSLKNYDLVCYVHDKKSGDKPMSIGQDFSYRCWDNLLKNDILVKNIIQTFANNPRLGMLFAPPIYHGSGITILTPWTVNFEITKNLANEIGVKVPMNKNQLIAPLGTMFWFRPKSIDALMNKNWQYTDFPEEPVPNDGTIMHAVERIFPLVAQHNGYYSSWIISEEFAKTELENIFWLYDNRHHALTKENPLTYIKLKHPRLFAIIKFFYQPIKLVKYSIKSVLNKK
jgi:rhamnosyltransferase